LKFTRQTYRYVSLDEFDYLTYRNTTPRSSLVVYKTMSDIKCHKMNKN